MTGTDANEPSQATREWIAARERTGNWYDIAPSEQIPGEVTPQFRTILHMFQRAFAPEVRRRKAQGTIDDRFVLRMAQLLQREGRPTEIRLNDEVRGIALTRVDRPVSPADPVYLNDLVGLEDFELDPSELDAGHFTLFGLDGDWRAVFDFRSGRAKAGDLLGVAAEFLAAARYSVEQGNGNAGVDNLFSACELVAKSHLILQPGRGRLRGHGTIKSALNLWSRYGNVDGQFTKLFNRLFDSRAAARYEAADVASPSLDDIGLVEAEIRSLRRGVGHRIRDKGTASAS